MIDNNIEVEGGTEVLIRVEPVEVISDEEVGSDVTIEKRKCHIDSEVPSDMKLFKKYSRNACIFNCMYEYR